MNSDNMTTGQVHAVVNPSLMNGNNNMTTSNDKKTSTTASNNKNTKVTLDKNGKPKRKKASRGTYRSFPGLIVACQSCQKAHLTCDDGNPAFCPQLIL